MSEKKEKGVKLYVCEGVKGIQRKKISGKKCRRVMPKNKKKNG